MKKTNKLVGLIIILIIATQSVFAQKTTYTINYTAPDSAYFFVSWLSPVSNDQGSIVLSADNEVVKAPSESLPSAIWRIIDSKNPNVLFFITCIRLGYIYAPIEYDYKPTDDGNAKRIKWEIEYSIQGAQMQQGTGTITTDDSWLSVEGAEKFIKATGYPGTDEEIVITNFRKAN